MARGRASTRRRSPRLDGRQGSDRSWIAVCYSLAVSRAQLPLIGLLEDAVLPGEERALAPPAVDPGTLAALERALRDSPHGLRLCALTITSAVELPSLVTSRWGTECTVVAAEAASVTLRGERRVRLLSARGKESPYTADVEVSPDPPGGGAPAELVAGAHAVLAALEAGALPEVPDWAERISPAIGALVRALTPAEALKETLRHPLPEALRKLAQTLAARSPGQHGACALEAMARELAGKPDVPKPTRQRLWSQVVEIQKRLDIHDPSVPEEEGDDVSRLQRKLMQAGLPKAAREVAKRELRLLRGMSSNHHDYSTYVAHLDFMARLPWQPDPPRPIDLAAVQAALDREHSGMEKAKQRVLEHLAVRALGGESSSMILCLSGPPGVGKTSIAHAIAEALGRPFVRVPLGGVHDEGELRGHRLSFTAASAGRILKGLAQAGSASALVLLDEIDKIGTDRQRSPAAALLEVLDPEQNTHFQDNYLGVPYDLSHVLFIATANETSHLHPTLMDRMEPVELDGYTAREKSAIARAHLLERLRAEHGLPAAPEVEDEALRLLVEGHTREAGVRQLRRALGAVFRARALALVRGGADAGATAAAPITAEEIAAALGPARYAVATLPDALPPGVATGMSVGPGGGSILFLEVGVMPGKGRLTLTGRLGEVMRETAHAALALLRVDPGRFGAERARLAAADLHLHVPDAATAKDGPSAGIAVFCAMLGALTGKPVRADVAMTGELSLTGRVLPVGGVRAKLLAAERAGVRRVILPEGNRADVPPDLSAEVITARSIEEVVAAAFPDGAVAPKKAKASAAGGAGAPKAKRAAKPARKEGSRRG